MRLSEFKGDEAFEVLADLLDPIAEIATDKEFIGLVRRQGVKIAEIVKAILKDHPKSIKTILAVLDRKDPETYEPTLLEIPRRVLELINDPDVMSLFGLQSSTRGANSSTSASEIITASEE